jgi:large subunit ribosomal protein L13
MATKKTKTPVSKSKTSSKKKVAASSKKSATKKISAGAKGRETPNEAHETVTPKPKKQAPVVKRNPLMPQTFYAKPIEKGQKWRLIDATGITLGRLSTYIADAIRGKDQPYYTPSADSGDFVVVINAEKVVLTGNKLDQKEYFHHTNYAGGIKRHTAREILEKHPERLIEKAVYGMLPKGHLARQWFKKLRVFAGPTHPHAAQQPVPVNIAHLNLSRSY